MIGRWMEEDDILIWKCDLSTYIPHWSREKSGIAEIPIDWIWHSLNNKTQGWPKGNKFWDHGFPMKYNSQGKFSEKHQKAPKLS